MTNSDAHFFSFTYLCSQKRKNISYLKRKQMLSLLAVFLNVKEFKNNKGILPSGERLYSTKFFGFIKIK